ncbi:response regulator [uncultured Thiodictyon sp.]|uniref:response regulator n=1 Tax=uncultured Thiodictyon sp. TaxID=1846217 RepID=UPI0025EF56F9|nr:response regulator [uncultured Thiodictyon sp.]
MNTPLPCRILVVEDHPSLRRNLVALLEDEDFVVSEAASGEDALKLIAEQDFQVAVVDVRLPGMNGIELIERAGGAYPHLRFLIHTGSVDYVLTPEIIALGMGEDDVFYKPISDLETFFSRIRCLCGGAD